MKAEEALAIVSGHVDAELLLRNEYLAAENEILRSKLKGRVQLTDSERIRLAKIGEQLGLKALKDVAAIVKPETILAWYQRFIAQKFDGSCSPKRKPGQPPISSEVQALVLKFAQENPSWGYDRIAGALHNLGHEISDQTVGNILAQHGTPPSGSRQSGMRWAEFIRTHQKVITACDFFSTEVLTATGLITIYVLFFIKIATREVHIAGITQHPHEFWMEQTARNLTMADDGFLEGQRYLILDRDTKFTASFRRIIKEAGIKPIRLPPRSPNLNAYAERFVRSIKSECLSRLVFFSLDGLRHAIREYITHYHEERNHQGLGNNLLQFKPPTSPPGGPIACRERLGGLLRYYHRQAA